MLISWTKLLFTLIVNKRKIKNKLNSLFASLILGFRHAAKRVSTTDETKATDSPPAPCGYTYHLKHAIFFSGMFFFSYKISQVFSIEYISEN